MPLKFSPSWSLIHLGISAIVTVATVIFFFESSRWWISGIPVLAVVFYLGFIFICAANRNDRNEGLLPELEHSIWIFLFLFLIVLFGFANMYVKSCEIVDSNLSGRKEYLDALGNKCDRTGVLKDEYDAIYYSLVTLTTTGYGDYLPMDKWGRKLVILQLLASALLIAGGLAFLISRLAGYDQNREVQPQSITKKDINRYKSRTVKLNNSPVFLDDQTEEFGDHDANEQWKKLENNEQTDAQNAQKQQKIIQPMTKAEMEELYKYLKDIGKK